MITPEGLTTTEYQAIVADAAADARVQNLLSLGFGLVLIVSVVAIAMLENGEGKGRSH